MQKHISNGCKLDRSVYLLLFYTLSIFLYVHLHVLLETRDRIGSPISGVTEFTCYHVHVWKPKPSSAAAARIHSKPSICTATPKRAGKC